MFIGLNPSTADETENDPTIRRCIDYAQRWGYGGIYVTNLFAYRATDPTVMKAASDPIGPLNDQWIEKLVPYAELLVAIWGNHGRLHNRSDQIRNLLLGMKCLRMNKGGEPAHPLYQPKSAIPVPLSYSK